MTATQEQAHTPIQLIELDRLRRRQDAVRAFAAEMRVRIRPVPTRTSSSRLLEIIPVLGMSITVVAGWIVVLGAIGLD